MAQSLPYLASYKNVGRLFEKILTAQKPDTFTHTYLQDTIGLKGTGDRPLIPFLRTLGFLDAGNRPTAPYDLLKNPAKAKSAIASGIKLAYEPLFKANESADKLSTEELKGLISQVTGADTDMVKRIATTFSAIVKHADFSATQQQLKTKEPHKTQELEEKHDGGEPGLRPEFHYNIQVHLPGNGTEETYLNIFNALRRTFK
ncbi:MAG TPA: DUF5343 domain-containing protein [Candidatus Acidoferrales bacterium]|nr:DUF5343 domain-containing protein [Candidatus Acidoferrum sp.]HEV2298031.1 DUF5343 domain-containing protein [Candidatus Acidoferrales bacterium]